MSALNGSTLRTADLEMPGVLVSSAFLFLVYFFFKQIQARRRYNAATAFGQQHGCQPMAVLFPTRWPLGIDVLKEQFTAIGENRLFAYQKPYIDRLGPNFEAKLLGSSGFTTADPVNIEAVLCSRFEDYVMGMRRPALLPFIGEGIFIQDGEAWKHSREMLRRPFLKSHYQNLEGFKGPIERLLATLSSSDGVVDLQPLFFKFTLATTTALIFGQSIDDIDDHDQASFATNFDYASLISSLRIRLMNFYWLYAPSNYRRSCERVRKFADEFVRRALEVEKDDKAEKSEHDYAFIMDLHKGIRDPALVRDQLVNVLLAGRDTTACLLSWAFFLLIRHPASLERLRDEIHSVAADDQEITRAHIQKMAYLKCILNETLRLYPSVPINLRIADKPTFLPRGGGSDGNAPVLVRPGISVGILPYYMHRRQDLYGEDATDFRPERWEGSKLANIGYGYIPFHGGPRLCLGKDFALTEASYAIVRILQAFPDLRLPPGTPVVPTGQEKQSLTIFLSSADGCKILPK